MCALRVYAYVCAYPSLPDLTKSNRSELENFKGNSKKVNTNFFFFSCAVRTVEQFGVRTVNSVCPLTVGVGEGGRGILITEKCSA